MQYINVVVDNKSLNTDTFYTYAAPDEVQVGARLSVPFARRKKPVDAYCVETGVTPSFDPAKAKMIDSFDPDRSLSQEMIDTALWMRKRYGVKYIDAIKMFTTAGKREPKRKYPAPDGDSQDPEHVTVNDPGYELSEEQKHAADKICKYAGAKEFRAFLIKGVTNSGKTEVYMRTAEKVLSMGRSVIVLLPEIALAEQVKRRFEVRFGPEKVATLHSKLTTSAKLGEWLRIRRGEARIVVGARTSVFTPFEDIGAVIIDEEHESTFKSDHNPKYDTVDIAYRRAMQHNAVLILGSATPSVVTYYRACAGVYDLIEMKHRIGDSIMPELEIVDMRKETLAGNISVISRKLAGEIDAALNRKSRSSFSLTGGAFQHRSSARTAVTR